MRKIYFYSDTAMYLTPRKLPFGGVRYTGEAIAKQMKSATDLKGTILQKADQRCTSASYTVV